MSHPHNDLHEPAGQRQQKNPLCHTWPRTQHSAKMKRGQVHKVAPYIEPGCKPMLCTYSMRSKIQTTTSTHCFYRLSKKLWVPSLTQADGRRHATLRAGPWCVAQSYWSTGCVPPSAKSTRTQHNCRQEWHCEESPSHLVSIYLFRWLFLAMRTHPHTAAPRTRCRNMAGPTVILNCTKSSQHRDLGMNSLHIPAFNIFKSRSVEQSQRFNGSVPQQKCSNHTMTMIFVVQPFSH